MSIPATDTTSLPDKSSPTVVVAVLTYQRNDMLQDFFHSFAEIDFPQGSQTILLIVDNAKGGPARSVVERYQERFPDLRYVVEPNAGIPFARNRAIDESLKYGADLLCFIDDDEYPDRQWLSKLIENWRRTGSNLLGGPVKVGRTVSEVGLWKKLINASLIARQGRKHAAALRTWERGGRPHIATGNWMGDLHWLKQSGLRFNTDMVITGGSDTAFFKATIAAGGKTAWCPDAIAYETITPDRLTLRYQFFRGASQSATHFHMKYGGVTPKVAITTTLSALSRFLLSCFLLLCPIHGLASLTIAFRSLGWSAGRMMGTFGYRSKLYDRSSEMVTGHVKSKIDDFLDGPNQSKTPIVRRLLAETKGHRGMFALAILAMGIVAASTAGLAWLMRSVINDIFVDRNLQAVWLIAATVMGLSIMKGFADYAQALIMARISNGIAASLKRRMFDKILSARMDFFSQAHSSKIVARFSNGSRAATSALTLMTTGIARNFLTLVGLVIVMVVTNPKLSVVAILAGPLLVFSIHHIIQKVRQLTNSEFHGIEAGISAVQETCQGIGTVKSFNLESVMRTRLNEAVAEVEARGNSLARVGKLTSPLMETLGGIVIGGMIIYAGWQTIQVGSTPGEFMAFLTALLLAYEPAKKLVRERVNLSRCLSRARKMYNVLDLPLEEPSGDHPVPACDHGVELNVSDLSFGYGHGEVLRDISLDVNPGEIVALVGPSGAGKSTLFSLLQRFYEPQQGSISINGIDIGELEPSNVRRLMAVVSQNTTLFSGTIAENIRMGSPQATHADIVSAAKVASAYDFIMALPQGFDTEVAERHATLSGGQAQRLAIARAVLKDAPLLLLDEATSALDSETERDIQIALKKLMQGRTTMVIAHRRSTIERANRIYVLENGRVAHAGRHEDLMQRSEPYRKLFGEVVTDSLPTAA